MCKWCDKDRIKDLKEYADTDNWERTNCIVYDKDNETYNIWVECEDFYYSGKEIWDIQFCPYCGRKLE